MARKHTGEHTAAINIQVMATHGAFIGVKYKYMTDAVCKGQHQIWRLA